MLLKHLYDYAHSRNLLEAPAFLQKAVRWIIDLDADGNLLGQGPIDTAKDGKRGKEFSCPQTTRNKNKGGISEFLADGITAIFGLEGDPRQLAKETENKQTARRRNNASKQKAFWEQIQTANDSEKCKGMLSAVVAFGQTLDADEPPTFIRYGRKADDGGKKESRSAWWIRRAGGSEEKLGPENFTFRVNGNLLLEDEDIRDWWRAQYAAEISDTKTKAKRGLCIITGKVNQPIAETHGVKIMSVPGGQSSGASLVSFDKDAFTSYGFQKSLNCPTSEDAAIAYCKALNALIQGDDTSLRIGGTILCFWAKETKNVGNLFASLLNKPDPQVVATFMKAPWAGIERELAKKDSFVAVTLKGCGGRVAVSYWIQEPLDQAIENFKTWFADLEITAPPRLAAKAAKKTTEKRTEYNPFSIYWLANTTVREAKELRPETLSQLYRAALEGSAPSIMLIKPILEQLRSRLLGDKNYKLIYDESRFALLKLILNRNRKESDMEIRPYITADTDDPAYNCGRILAILSQTQKKALGNWNLSGVAERYFGTASAAPATVLPLLIRLNRHHLDKIRKSGGSVYEEKILRDVLACFKGKDDQPPAFPRYLDLQAQGRFALGFYQQQAEDENARVAVKVMTYLNETDAPTHTEMLVLQESDLQIFYENINQHYGSASFKEWSDKKRKKETVVSSPSATNTFSD